MPEDNLNEILNILLNEVKLIPLTKRPSIADEFISKRQCDDYFNNTNKDITRIKPLAIYYIIKKLSNEEQINFIKENIEYIKKNDEDIFLYTLESPKSLSYYFSLNVIKEIYKLDRNIFCKILNGNFKNLVYGFDDKDYIEFYTYFYEELIEMDNDNFIENIYYHRRIFYDENNLDSKNWEDIILKQKEFSRKFISFLVVKYKDKVDTFDGRALLNFINYCDNLNLYKKFINNNINKFKKTIENMNDYELADYIEEIPFKNEQIFIPIFIRDILKKDNLKYILSKISFSIIYDLYKEDKTIFEKVNLEDWLYISNDKKIFDSKMINILDNYKIDKIENLFDYNSVGKIHRNSDLSALKYIEKKYRKSITLDGIVTEITDYTKIFSEEYFKNLSELKNLLKNGEITKNSILYKKVFQYFLISLKNKNIVTELNDINIGELENLFYKILNGESISILYKLSSIENIALYNRIGNLALEVSEFSVEQIEKYNIKEFKNLCRYMPINEADSNLKKLILKLYLLVGYEKAKFMLEVIDGNTTTLEHLVGNVYVKDITFDNSNNVILNKRIINMLFNDKGYSKIKEMLHNKNSNLYKYFPRIFNEWKYIEIYNKDKSINTVINFLKGFEIYTEPKYYRLSNQFKYIGCKDNIIKETLMLHDKMIDRVYSTIPRVCGNLGEYSYEVLKLHDMDILSVGSITNCCFSILNAGYDCLKHAALKGRVLVIKKSDELVAHSWLWRNGNLLCLDNIEVAPGIKEIEFLNVYLKFADEIVKKSIKYEGIDGIKNVTIGYPSFSKPIIGIDEYPYFISKQLSNELNRKNINKNIVLDTLPAPIEVVNYLDSKNIQYLIKGNGNFKFYKSAYSYLDERDNILYYNSNNNYDIEYLQNITDIINALRYIKFESNLMLDKYKGIDIDEIKEIYCNEDWYSITYKNNIIEEYINFNDERALIEKQSILKDRKKVLVKKINN